MREKRQKYYIQQQRMVHLFLANELHAKLKQQRPDLAVSGSEVRAALRSLEKEAKAEAEAVEANRKRLRDALLGAGPSSDSSLA